MSSSSSILRAQATHDAAMSIIAKEARDRAAKTEHLRQLRLAAEAQAATVDQFTVPRAKTPVSARASSARRARPRRAS